MKKILTVATLGATFLGTTSSAFALTVNTCPAGDFAGLCNFSLSGNFIAALITTLFILSIIVAIVYLIWGGLKWIMSGGDKGKVTEAREHIIAAIIGLVVVFLVYFLINFVVNDIFGHGNVGLFTIPSFQ